jgi:SOS-response transcriptional repressor LexA
MSTLPLTAKQEQLWRFIKSCARSPSYTEMAMALYGHHNAKGRINMLVCALKERGFVDYTPNRRRTIVALDPPALASGMPTSALLLELHKRGIDLAMVPFRGRIS